jgi:hypothetical protein
VWPVHSRRIYDPDSHVYEGAIDVGQTLPEFDFLVTSANEWYFALVIFGLELTINLGGPDVEGCYERWLVENDNASPPVLRQKCRSAYARPSARRLEALIEHIERALVLLAYFIELDGD